MPIYLASTIQFAELFPKTHGEMTLFVFVRKYARNGCQLLQEIDGAVRLRHGKCPALRAAAADGQHEEMVAEQEAVSQLQGSANGTACEA